MIRAVCGELSLRIQGHAGLAPRGGDPLCAAVTGLMLTLAESVRRARTQGRAGKVRIVLRSGDGLVCCGQGDEKLKAVFEAAALGLACLQKAHPENLRVRNLPARQDTMGAMGVAAPEIAAEEDRNYV